MRKKGMTKIMKRENWQFKLLYTVGIIFVVSGHCGNGGISLFYEWFTPYAFHLGIFAFSSGYFYKNNVEEDVIKYISYKFKKLILPYYIYNFAYALFTIWMQRNGFAFGGGGGGSKYKEFVH